MTEHPYRTNWKSDYLPRRSHRKWPGWFRLTAIIALSALLWAIVIGVFL